MLQLYELLIFCKYEQILDFSFSYLNFHAIEEKWEHCRQFPWTFNQLGKVKNQVGEIQKFPPHIKHKLNFFEIISHRGDAKKYLEKI